MGYERSLGGVLPSYCYLASFPTELVSSNLLAERSRLRAVVGRGAANGCLNGAVRGTVAATADLACFS